MKSLMHTSVLTTILAFAAVPAFAVSIPYVQPFNTDTLDAATTYPDFTASLGGGTATVTDGVLHLNPSEGGGDQSFTVAISPAPTEEFNISAGIGASNSNGNYHVALIVGQNRIAFHPGFDGAAFRVDGPGGFGNQNIGFTPANNVLHFMEVQSLPDGTFNIEFTDGANPLNVYTNTFNNPASYGGPVGFFRSGPPNGDGQFDNLQIVPEPSVVTALAFGFATLAGIRRRRA